MKIQNLIKIFFLTLLVLTISCQNDKNTEPILSLGDSYMGGIIAYKLTPIDPGFVAGKTHGIIIAPTDQSTGATWYNEHNSITGATLREVGTGIINTNTIVNGQGNGNYAAKICFDLVLNGYSDWALPSDIELSRIGDYTGTGRLTPNPYWSSTEDGIDAAGAIDFGQSSGGSWLKDGLYHVRAIRYF